LRTPIRREEAVIFGIGGTIFHSVIYTSKPGKIKVWKESWAKHLIKERVMLWTVLVLLVALWVWGLVTQVAGGMIHLLLLAAAAVGIIKILLSGRQSVL